MNTIICNCGSQKQSYRCDYCKGTQINRVCEICAVEFPWPPWGDHNVVCSKEVCKKLYQHTKKIKQKEKEVILAKKETFGPRFYLRCQKTPMGVVWNRLDPDEIDDDRYYHLEMGLDYHYNYNS